MKEILFLAVFSLFCTAFFSQEVVENPKFSATTAPYVKLKKVQLYDTATILDFEVEYFPNWWIMIEREKCYIQNSIGGEKLYVTSAENLVFDKQHFIPESGIIQYSLHFPLLDPSTEMFDYREDRWNIMDIELQPQEHFSVIPDELQGNWLRTDGSNEWVYGIYDDLVIYRGEAWNQILMSAKGKRYELTLQRDGNHERVFIKLAKKGNLLIGSKPEQLELFSLEKTRNPAYTIPNDSGFEAPLFDTGNAVYRGYIDGYHPKMGKTGRVVVRDIITRKHKSHLISINPDGTFRSEFPMIYPQEILVRLPRINETVIMKPGSRIFHYMELGEYTQPARNFLEHKKRERKSLFMGDYARLNWDLQMVDSITTFNYREVQDTILFMSADDFKEYCFDILNKEENGLNRYAGENLISNKALQVKSQMITYRTHQHILSYNRYVISAYRKKYRIPREQRKIPLEPEVLSPSYFDFIMAADLNNQVSLVSGSAYGSLINRIRFADCVKPLRNYAYAAVYDSLMDKCMDLPDVEKAAIERFINCTTDDCIRKVRQEDDSLLSVFSEKHKDLFSSLGRSAYQSAHEKRIETYFGIGKGFARELMYGQYKCEIMSGKQKPFTEEEKIEISTRISNPFILNHIMEFNRGIEKAINAKLEANKQKTGYIINETPKTEADKIFDAITEKYRGKVIFVDFWATWCGPCISGMKRIKPLKEELKEEDIVFVYITNPSSPVDTWNMMIPDIKGEHYRLEQDEWNIMSARFNITGIPHYVLVDKSGAIAEKKIFFASSNDELKELFKKHLSE